MDKTIYKYPLEIVGEQAVPVPFGAEILCVQTQNNKPCLWALVFGDNSPEDRIIEIFGTGHPVPWGNVRKYLGTVQTDGGSLVWHVFERL